MKYTKYILISLLLFWVTPIHAQVVFPNRGGTGIGTIPTFGQVLVGNSSGTYTLTATSSLGITGGSSGALYPFTPAINYAVLNQATTGIAWFQNGINASTTSHFVNASTTALSADSICFTVDTCRTTWPSTFGGIGGTWSTTTSQVAGNLINYPNNSATDVVNIGSTATTTGEYWFNPNINVSHLAGSTLFGLATTTKQSVGGGGPETIGIMRTNNNDLAIWSGIQGDTEGRWLVEANGLVGWGAGGVSDQDINLFRGGIGNLTVQSFISNSTDGFRVNQVDGSSVLTVNTTSEYVSVPWLLVNGAGGGAKMDVYGGGTTAIRAEQPAVSDVAFSSFKTGDTQLRFSFLTDGTLKWGPGTAVADTQLSRTATGTLAIEGIVSNPKLGIGTSSPYVSLAVVGDIVASHIYATSTTPTITACGTSPSIATGSSDSAGVVTAGTGGGFNFCRVNFGKIWVSPPVCVVIGADGQAVTYDATTTVTYLSVNSAAAGFGAPYKFNYICLGNR